MSAVTTDTKEKIAIIGSSQRFIYPIEIKNQPHAQGKMHKFS